MNAFETLTYLIEHAENGSVAALVTQDNTPIILTKDDEYSFSAYICTNTGDVKHIRKEFDKTTFHKAIIEFLDEIGDFIGKEVTELSLSNIALFPNCVPKREEKKEHRREINITEKISEYKKLNSPYYAIPLLTDNGKLFAFIPEIDGTADLDFITKSICKIEEKPKPVNLDLNSIYPLLFTSKLDLKMGNPFTSSGNYTFFTAVYVYQDSKGVEKFMNQNMLKSSGRFLSTTPHGSMKTENLEFLSSAHKKGNIYVGFFIKGEKIIEIQNLDLIDMHLENKIRVNDYVFSSFSLTAKNGIIDFQSYDRAMSNFINFALAKSNGREVLKDVIEIHSMGGIDLPFVKNSSPQSISVIDPISFWYYKIYEKTEELKECTDCPLAEKVKERNSLISLLRRKGWISAFLL
jgi:hypothetical protein